MNPWKIRTRFRNYLLLEALVIFGVIGAFKVIQDRGVASIVASSLFLVSTLFILYWESKYPGFQRRASFWGLMIFLVLSVIPVMALRFLNWGVPFQDLSVAGIPGAQLHQFSNYMFLLMLVCFFIDNFLEIQRLRRLESER